MEAIGYNERLFSGGLRRYVHLARFRWLRETIAELNCKADSVLEIGCFDGRAIEYLPKLPTNYYGFDANMGGGLDMAIKKWGSRYTFRQGWKASEMEISGQRFELAVALETMEHVEPSDVPAFLAKIAGHLDGYFLVTVPVEIGPVFFAKHAAKAALGHDFGGEQYTWREIVYASIGMSTRVIRHHHKGFDYRRLVDEISGHFDVLEVEGRPFHLPLPLNFSACIVAKSK